MSMKTDITYRLLLGVTSGMFIIIVGMMGVIWNDIKGDIREVKSTTAMIQQEYYRIAVLESSVNALTKKVDRLGEQIDNLRFGE